MQKREFNYLMLVIESVLSIFINYLGKYIDGILLKLAEGKVL